MDSISNLALLEIAGEDDSLLLEVPRGTRDDSTVTTATNIFSCSPLQCLRSLPPHPPQTDGSREGTVDSEMPSSSPKDITNKENVNWSRSEAPPKLSVEPQQMKRKRKGVGYNLRKSLAWDRAFFTEEGVLNSLELSMISGTAAHSWTNTQLSVIHEEEQNILAGKTEPTNASSALQEIEENLFQQSSEGTSIEHRKIGACSSATPDALTKDTPTPASLAKRKVLAGNDIVINRSKRNACPRPVVSSSLKRPDKTKTPSKESKVTKIPGPKSNVPVFTTAGRSGIVSTGHSKGNQNAHPTTNVQKYAGVKGLSKSTRTVPSNPKVNLADKCSVARTLTKHAGKHLDSSVSETHPPFRLHQLGTQPNKVSEACLPHRVSNTVEKKQQTHLQATKPSGLRMPSPSLGFFSQAKASSSRSQLQKSSKPCTPAESNISKLRKFEANSVNEARLPHALMKSSTIVKRAAENCNKKRSLSDVKSEPSLQVDNSQMASVEAESDFLGFKKITKEEIAENILEHVKIKSERQAELHKSKNVSTMEDVEFPRHNNKLLSKNHTHEQLEKDAEPPLEEKLYDVLPNRNVSVSQEPQSMHKHSLQRTLTKDKLSSTAPNIMGKDEDKQIKLLTCDVQNSNENSVLQAKNNASYMDNRYSGEIKEYNCVKTALVDSSLSNITETTFGGSLQGFPYKNTEQVNDGAGDFDKNGGDAQVPLLNENLSVECNDTTHSILEAANRQLQCSHEMDENCGEQLETPNPIVVGEISLKSEKQSHVNSCHLVHVTTLSSKGSLEKSIPEINGACQSKPEIAEMEDCQHPGAGQSCFIQRRPVDEGYDLLIDSNPMHDKTQAFELDTVSGDCVIVSPAACSTEGNNVSPESRPFYENKIENLHFSPLLCPMVQADCGSRGNDMLISNGCTISELQPRDDGSSRDNSMNCDVQSAVPGNFEQQVSLLTASETNIMLCEDESEFSEVSAYINSNSKDSIGCGAENPFGLLQHTPLLQAIREIDQTNKENEESHVDGAQAQSSDENLVAYTCSIEHCISVANDQFSLSDDNVNEQSHLSELQRPSLVGVYSQHVNNKLHLNGDSLPANTACSWNKNFFMYAAAKPFLFDIYDGFDAWHIERCILNNLNGSKKSATKSKLDIPTIKPPPNVAPFSDEWLAAIEAAGEEILTMKSGAVQNSPPDKFQHEPGPWSPVGSFVNI